METIFQALGKLLQGKQVHPCGGQLQRERDAVEVLANRRDRRGILVSQLDMGQEKARTREKELDRLRVSDLRRCYCLERACRHCQRRNLPDRLPDNVEDLAAGDQQRKFRAGGM